MVATHILLAELVSERLDDSDLALKASAAQDRIERHARRIALCLDLDPVRAERLGIARVTVASLLKEQLAELDPGVDASRAEALEHSRQVVSACWSRIQASGKLLADGTMVPTMQPLAMAGLLNTALAAQDRINKFRGVQLPERYQHEFRSLTDFAREYAGKPREQRLRLVEEN
jgi:hypothetical protein